jgi:hypothetical protein
MKSSRLTGCGTVTSGWVALALAIVAAPVLAWPELSAAEEIISGEVLIEATALRPQVLMTEPEHRVIFVNRSGRTLHLDFMIRDPELHHVFQVPDRIWAIFHRAGRHPYEVHFSDRALPDLHGAIEVVGDPYGGPDPRVCGGITVQGACIER